MIKVLSTNIISPLGFSTDENYQALQSGQSGLCRYEKLWDIPEVVCASLFSEEQKGKLQEDGLTRFESLVYASIKDALQKTDIDATSPRVAFILASTKGNVEELESTGTRLHLSEAAQEVAWKLGLATAPFVVCNACISGSAAQLLALRLIDSGFYDYAIVTGADCQSKFIISGFSSLKALSSEPCRPFDIERFGLNLGEAAATIIYGRSAVDDQESWHLADGAVRNDAIHISNPSKTAEGCFRAIESTLGNDKDISLVSVHGTATLYNDQMESVALKRSELLSSPAMALKGYYGHTMGASGILETIISMRCLDDGRVLPSKGFTELGVSGQVKLSNQPVPLSGHRLLKTIAGFGGCNCALFLEKTKGAEAANAITPSVTTTHRVSIKPDAIVVDGKAIATEEQGKSILTEAYKRFVNDYPKFYKMDILSRVAFIASELLLQAENEREAHKEDRSVILFNCSSSIVSDRNFQETIALDNYFPSPAVFVYTLPNIATGEIAIRNGYFGETSFYIISQPSQEQMDRIIAASFADGRMKSTICGWINADDENSFEAELSIQKINP